MTEMTLFFLKNFPPWIVLTALFVALVLFYRNTGDIAYKEWASLALASLFTALGVRAFQPQQQNTGTTESGDVIMPPTPPPEEIIVVEKPAGPPAEKE